MDLDKIYTEVIMGHNKSGHNKRELENPNYTERGHNPNCGDDFTIQLKIEENKIIDGGFVGVRCAISTASASILFDLIIGRDIEDGKRIVGNFLKMIKQEKISENDKEELEDAGLLENISKMPGRVKCVTLTWNAIKVIFEKL